MALTKTMLAEDMVKLPADRRNRHELVELFYQRLYNTIQHVRSDIECIRENSVLKLGDLKELYMVMDLFIIQMEEVVDKIKNDQCPHNHIVSAEGRKVCEYCGAQIG